MSWKHRTLTGRVVYDRPRHVFKYRDIARILRDSIGSYEGNDPANVVFVWFQAIRNLQARCSDMLSDIAWEAVGLLGDVNPLVIEAAHIIVDVLRILGREIEGQISPISWKKTKKGFFFQGQWIPNLPYVGTTTTNNYLAALRVLQEESKAAIEEVEGG